MPGFVWIIECVKMPLPFNQNTQETPMPTSMLWLLVGYLAIVPVLSQAAPAVAGCQIFPNNNVWNARIDKLPVHPRSPAYINSIGAGTGVHPDFGSGLWEGAPIGIPYTTVPGSQPKVPITFEYQNESDPGPYPIPKNPPIEGGENSDGDRHVLIVDRGHCKLYEVYAAYPQSNGSWEAGSGAVYDLDSNRLRPSGWTSADAAGLPILAGLARCDELRAGIIKHALRFTAENTQRKYVWPARHFASDITTPNVPPMGQRFRLKGTFDVSKYSPQTRVILTALKRYGLILADNGGDWYISGAPGDCWDDETLVEELATVKGSDFEAVDGTSILVNKDSGRTAARLLITKRGTGQGQVQSQPAGIDCGTVCGYNFDVYAKVTLTATSVTGSTFGGWSGDCQGTASVISVVMGRDKACVATFN
jgi:hypothetical protein